MNGFFDMIKISHNVYGFDSSMYSIWISSLMKKYVVQKMVWVRGKLSDLQLLMPDIFLYFD